MRDKQLDKRIAKDRRRLKQMHYKAHEDADHLNSTGATPEDEEKHGSIPWNALESKKSKSSGSQ